MNNKLRRWSKLLLWMHLFVCLVWLALFHSRQEPAEWMIHVFLWSILGIQFTWGFTVGLIVGPSRKRRSLLWWSLLTVFMPLWFFSLIVRVMFQIGGPLVALIYLAVFVILLACETFGGVLLGARIHSEQEND